MSNRKNDKKFVLTIIAACVIVILIFHFAWAKQLFINYRNPFFTFVDGALMSLFIYESISAYRFEADYAKDWLRKLLVYIAAASALWAAGWSADVNENKMFEQDAEKAKHAKIQVGGGDFIKLLPNDSKVEFIEIQYAQPGVAMIPYDSYDFIAVLIDNNMVSDWTSWQRKPWGL